MRRCGSSRPALGSRRSPSPPTVRSSSSPAGPSSSQRRGRSWPVTTTSGGGSRRATPIELLADEARRVGAPCPTLVQLGRDDDDRDVYVDLEALEAIEVGGPGDQADAIVHAIAATLAASVLAEVTTLVGVGVEDDAFLGHRLHRPGTRRAAGVRGGGGCDRFDRRSPVGRRSNCGPARPPVRRGNPPSCWPVRPSARSPPGRWHRTRRRVGLTDPRSVVAAGARGRRLGTASSRSAAYAGRPVTGGGGHARRARRRARADRAPRTGRARGVGRSALGRHPRHRPHDGPERARSRRRG